MVFGHHKDKTTTTTTAATNEGHHGFLHRGERGEHHGVNERHEKIVETIPGQQREVVEVRKHLETTPGHTHEYDVNKHFHPVELSRNVEVENIQDRKMVEVSETHNVVEKKLVEIDTVRPVTEKKLVEVVEEHPRIKETIITELKPHETVTERTIGGGHMMGGHAGEHKHFGLGNLGLGRRGTETSTHTCNASCGPTCGTTMGTTMGTTSTMPATTTMGTNQQKVYRTEDLASTEIPRMH